MLYSAVEKFTCKNCGEEFEGNYCNHCGQRRIERHRFQEIKDSIGDALELKRGFLKTIIGLFKRPSVVVQDYLYGKTKPYQNPFSLLLAVAVITYLIIIILEKLILKEENETSEIFIYTALLIFVFVFVQLLKLFFSKSKFNFFERLIIATYLSSVLIVYIIVLDKIGQIFEKQSGLVIILIFAITVLVTIQFCVPLFRNQKRVWFKTILLGILGPIISISIIELVNFILDLLGVNIFRVH